MLSQPVDKRRRRRTRTRLAAAITIDESSPTIPCVVWDISDGGAKLAAGHPRLLPERFTLMFPNSTHRRCQVRWRSEKFIGVTFVNA